MSDASKQMILPGTVIDPRMFEGEASEGLADQAKIVVALYKEKQTLKKKLEEVQTQFNHEDAKMTAIMERDGVTSMVVGNNTVYRREQTYVSINKAEEMKAQSWLREQGYGMLIRESVNTRTLSAAYKEMIELDIKVPTDLFNINPKISIGVRRK